MCKPSFRVDPPLRIDPLDLLAGEDFSDDPTSATSISADAVDSNLSYRNRFRLNHPTDPIGLSGLLLLPQSFGFSLSLSLIPDYSRYISCLIGIRCAERSISEKHSVAILASTIVPVPKFGILPLRFVFVTCILSFSLLYTFADSQCL